MQLVISQEDLRPIVEAVVTELLDRLAPMDDRLSAPEKEAARILGVTWNVLRDARLRGEIKASKIGKTWVYRRETLVRFLLDRERES